jgi:hypothetical protein
MSPGELWELTAAQVFSLFFKFQPPPGADAAADAVGLVATINRRRAARGELPTIPPHLLPSVPRE